MYKITKLYRDIEEKLFSDNNNADHMKLLAMLCVSVDDTLFEALENEYEYVNYSFERTEIQGLIQLLIKESYVVDYDYCEPIGGL